MSQCASATSGILAYSNVDLVPNGYIKEQDEDRNGEIIRQLPSSRITVELQYSVRSGVTGTSLNSLAGGNAGLLFGTLGGGAGFGIGSALGCSLQGDIEPTLSTFIFQVCDSQTRINRVITVTQNMIDEAEANGGTTSYTFFREYPLGVLSVTRNPIELSDEEIENIGSSGGPQRGWSISEKGQIEGSFDKFSFGDTSNLFTEIVRDERKMLYRADRNINLRNSAPNAFVNAGLDDLTDSTIRFTLPGYEDEVVIPSDEDIPVGEITPMQVGDPLYITYTGATDISFRHAIEARSFFFLFPDFSVERISGEQVKAWNFLPLRYKVRKSQSGLEDIENQADLNDWFADLDVLSDEELTSEEKDDQQVLETITGQRVIECLNDTKNERPYIRGIYFADTRGISLWDVENNSSGDTELLIAAEDIRDQEWWQNTVSALVDTGPGFNEEGHLDVSLYASNRVLRGFVFDISDHVNSVVYDTDKFGYQRGLADALKTVSRFDPDDDTTGIGISNLDLERLKMPRRNNFDLSSAVFKTLRMSSIEGASYFIRDCNKFFTYDQAFCTSGTLQADMFVRTPIFFEEVGKKGRVYIERFTPQFPLERDGGIWVRTRPTFGGGMSIDTHPSDSEAFLVFSRDETLNFMRFKDARTQIHKGKVTYETASTDLDHENLAIDTLQQSDITIVGFDKIIGNQPGYSRGKEITREGGKVASGLESYGDVYEVLSTSGEGTINFVHNIETGEAMVQGLQNRKIKSIKMYFKPRNGFLGQKTRYVSFVFPGNRLVIDNVSLPYAGGNLRDERFVKFDGGYYFDESIRLSGEILKYCEITRFDFVTIKEEKYEESFVETGSPAVCLDPKGRVFVFYEDTQAHIGEDGDQPEGCGELVDGGQTEISCLISYDLGETWYDHKGVVYSTGEDALRTPYVTIDKESGKIHLFFVLNDNLMHKTIDPNLFKSEDAYKSYKRPLSYTETTPDLCGLGHFSSAGAQLRRRDMNVVVGNINDEQSYLFQQISIDRNRKRDKLNQRITVQGDFRSFNEGFPDTDYIAYLDKKRAIRVLYTSNGRLFARSSDSAGLGWQTVLEEGSDFHRNLSIQEPSAITNLGTVLNEKSNSLDISYISNDMLFVRSFDNGGIFSENKERLLNIIDPDNLNNGPVFITGILPPEIVQGILSGDSNILFPYVSAALPLFDETMSISPVGMRGFVGKSGVVRMFYQDSNGDIRGFTYSKNACSLDAKAVANGE